MNFLTSRGAIFSLIKAKFTSIMGQPRTTYLIEKYRLLLAIFAKLPSNNKVLTIVILFNIYIVHVLV